MKCSEGISKFILDLSEKYPSQTEFIQAVEEVVRSVYPIVKENSIYRKHKILERLVEPDRSVSFRVDWTDDKGQVRTNRGYRVQFNNALGPYKGGLRFHPTVNLGILKFLGFEQIFKNSLTGQSLGGAKGGSDFNPMGKSDLEVMRFCNSFMEKLHREIGPDRDTPAGDIGVGLREIGYLFGSFRRYENDLFLPSAITGKGPDWGGSLLRPEATGYGLILFLEEMLKVVNHSLSGKRVCISGSGNVAQYAAEMAIESGAKVLTMSDSSGFIFDKNGLSKDKLKFIMLLKNEQRGRIKQFADEFDGVEYLTGSSDDSRRPWRYVKCDIALPCATQNEINEDDAGALVENGVMAVAEGANMPSTKEAIRVFKSAGVLFGPAKAANAGGVAVSGFEMSQDKSGVRWTRAEVLAKLRDTMLEIHKRCTEFGTRSGCIDYVEGSNIAGFKRVADAMVAQGL
ncbi:MAG: NADP-specific glutamate dehydrogenase [bacterium]|nr:NADP-specific glutamate dehydrogenase [bacterium]